MSEVRALMYLYFYTDKVKKWADDKYVSTPDLHRYLREAGSILKKDGMDEAANRKVDIFFVTRSAQCRCSNVVLIFIYQAYVHVIWMNIHSSLKEVSRGKHLSTL